MSRENVEIVRTMCDAFARGRSCGGVRSTTLRSSGTAIEFRGRRCRHAGSTTAVDGPPRDWRELAGTTWKIEARRVEFVDAASTSQSSVIISEVWAQRGSGAPDGRSARTRLYDSSGTERSSGGRAYPTPQRPSKPPGFRSRRCRRRTSARSRNASGFAGRAWRGERCDRSSACRPDRGCERQCLNDWRGLLSRSGIAATAE